MFLISDYYGTTSFPPYGPPSPSRNHETSTDTLQQVLLDLISSVRCSSDEFVYGDRVTVEMICAGEPGRDTCYVRFHRNKPLIFYIALNDVCPC